MAKTYRFGIIGCGVVSAWHADAIASVPGAVLAGCASAHAESCRKFAQKYQIRAFASPQELVRSDAIDVVCICTPSGLHAPQAVMAAEAGKHVLVEKPMAITVQQADDIVAACARTGVKIGVVSQLRFSQGIAYTKKIIETGALGRIVACDAYMKYYRSEDYYKSGGWRGTWALDGGGALMNQGIHGVDIIQYLGGRVKQVSAFCRTLRHAIETEDTCSALLEFESGALGVIEATTSVYPGYDRQFCIHGTEGSVVLREGNIAKWDVPSSPLPPEYMQDDGAPNGADRPDSIGLEGHIAQIADMVAAIREGREPAIGCREGKKPVEIICAIYESSRTGKVVALGK